MIFFAPGTPVDPPLAPTVRGPRCPPAAPSEHWYGGLLVSLGEFEAWKAQKVGGCRWTRCPRNASFEPRSPRYGPFLVSEVFDTHCAQSGPFLAIFGPFLGHIVELEGKNGLLVTGQSRRMWSVVTVSLRCPF